MGFPSGTWPYFGHTAMFKLPPKLSSLQSSHFMISILCSWNWGELVCSRLLQAALTETEVTQCGWVWCLGRMAETAGGWLGIISTCIYCTRLACASWQHGSWDLRESVLRKSILTAYILRSPDKLQGSLSSCLGNPRNVFPRNVLLLYSIGQSSHQGQPMFKADLPS